VSFLVWMTNVRPFRGIILQVAVAMILLLLLCQCQSHVSQSFTTSIRSSFLERKLSPDFALFNNKQEIEYINLELLNSSDVLKKLNSTISTSERSLQIQDEPSSLEQMEQFASPILSQSLILILGSYAVAAGLGELLVNFEIVQTWRYLWPFAIGSLYVIDAWTMTPQETMIPVGPFGKSMNPILSAVLGIALIIGGAYDAFMPVWMTGPNIVTQAGIGQDAAASLFVITASNIFIGFWTQQKAPKLIESPEDFIIRNNRLLLLQSTLLGQLYKLGESSFDEIIERLT
jgi:hypothetical protein